MTTYGDRPWLTAYPQGIPADPVIPSKLVPALLDEAARNHPDAAAIGFLGRSITYAELRRQVDAFAAALAARGVGRGDRVAFVLPNCPQFVIAFFATLRLGAIACPANPQYTEHELTHQIGDCGAKAVVTLDLMYPTVEAVRASGKTALRDVIVTSLIEYLPTVDQWKLKLPVAAARKAKAAISASVPSTATRFADLVRTHLGAAVPQAAADPSEVALLLYTTGTTGVAKGAMLTHRNLVANAEQCRLWTGGQYEPGEARTLTVLPMFHAYGMTLGLTSTIIMVGQTVLVPKPDQDLILAALKKFPPTTVPGVPPLYRTLLDNPHFAGLDMKKLYACVSGGMHLPPELAQQWEKRVGGYLVEGYGMTESSPVTHANPLSDARKLGTIGVPIPGTRARIVAADDPTTEMPVGEIGELSMSGPQIFAGYWNRPKETADTLNDGWLLTGDLARMDADGFFQIVDRKKDIIVAGGFNIYPTEIEDVLLSYPGVAEVAVVGVPDSYRGETVMAYVVPRPDTTLTEDELRTFAREQLTGYKVPKKWEFRDSLPTVGVGKVLRRSLRDQEIARQAEQGESGEASADGSTATGNAGDSATAPAANADQHEAGALS